MNPKSKALDALFGARQGLLLVLYLEPSRWWSNAELAQQLNTAVETLEQDLKVLNAGGILRSRGEKKAAEFQANPDCPFFAEIQAIIAKASTRDMPPGSETILLVDDQAATLKVAQILLESFGYNVLPADSAQQALILFRQHQSEIRLVLTDVAMPDITGPQLVERLKRMNPKLRVIYMSGYSNDELREQGAAFLPKPFNPAGLAKMVREALERKQV
jgi:CheY-like chemotaxis protein